MISALLIEYFKKGIFTLLGAMLAVYLFVILLTFTGNDPSWSHISSDMTTVSNTGGAMGAWLSDVLYSFFGFGAWWLIAFLAYESIWLWWGNKSTYWLVRMVAYVFLLLSGSALLTQLTTLLNWLPNWAMIRPSGVMGGIAGLELQLRLAKLLTPWGCVLFLTLFMLITATFAFNIHWRSVYQRLTNWSWLGTGVKEVDDGNSIANSQLTDDAKAKLTTAKSASSVNSTDDAVATEPSDLSQALSDFLASSGLMASVQASLATAPKSADLETPVPPVNPKSSASDGNQSPSAVKTTKSFLTNPFLNKTKAPEPVVQQPKAAWNDSAQVDEGLIEPALAPSFAAKPSSSFSYSIVEDETVAPNEKEPQSAAEVDDENVITEDLMQLAMNHNRLAAAVKSSLAEAKVLVAEADFEDELTEEWQEEDDNLQTIAESVEDPLADFDWEDDALIIDENRATETQVEPIEDNRLLDMTPTNTPPSNPAAPATALDESDNFEPSITFDVPKWQSDDAVIDSMTDEPSFPDIFDDASFATRSRAMQTAAYRAQLTPIPELDILDKPDPNQEPSYTAEELEQLSELLEIKLQEFNVKAEVVTAIPGPVVTRFEVELAAGVKASKVTNISRDLARSLSMASLRVVEVIAGKPYIGIEVPNKQREMVRLIELLDTKAYQDSNSHISMAMGKDISGKPIITDLSRAPHMLVAGTTGSGKSVLVNAMLLSMLLKYTPDELRLILIDPKQLELANYNDIPHLLTPVVTDMTEAASSLSWCVAEMERRYLLMSLLKVRKLHEFNKKVLAAEKAGQPLIDPTWRPNDSVSMDKAPKLKTLPLIVIVADEFADMIMQVGKQAEELITRLAQKSRAAGIHLMLATQRPSVDVITGLIKANIPVRAALRVNSKVDSRTILDSGGAEDMLGNGDMLFLGPGQIEPDRVHGAYVSDEEVNRVCDAWRERGAPDYIDNMAGNFELTPPSGSNGAGASGEDDDLYNDAVAFVMETRKVSASSIQRKFSIGYNRAARIVDSMEDAGLVSSMGKSGKRELLM